MTIKGIARSCLGDVFENREEVDKLAETYHKCWSEMEVKLVQNLSLIYKNETYYYRSVLRRGIQGRSQRGRRSFSETSR